MSLKTSAFLNKGEQQLNRVQITLKISLNPRGIFSHSPAFFNKIRVRKKIDKKILFPAGIKLSEDKEIPVQVYERGFICIYTFFRGEFSFFHKPRKPRCMGLRPVKEVHSGL